MPEVRVLIEDGSCVPLTTAYALMKSIYQSTDTFVADFADEFPSVEALRAYLAEVEARPGGVFLVARDGDEPVAFLLVKPRPQRKIGQSVCGTSPSSWLHFSPASPPWSRSSR